MLRTRTGIVMGVVLLAGTASAEQSISAVRVGELKHLVHHDCGSCHGMTLKGGLGPDIRPQTISGAPPEAVAAIILDGVPETAMPPWRPLLSEDDALWIANYLLAGR